MRFIDVLCPPALLYLLFVTIQVALDVSLGLYLTAGVKLLLGGAGVVILDALCGVDLGVVSWFIVAAPFVITALASSIALGLDADRRVTETFKNKLSPSSATATDDVSVTIAQTSGDEHPFSTNSPF